MNTLCLLNLNIWNYNEPWAVRRGLIAGLIARTRPDVVALQEVRYQSWLDPRHQADQILDELAERYHIVWQPAAYWVLDGGAQWEGLAVLSRYPIVDQATVPLERDPNDPRNPFLRRVLGAQVRVGDAHLWVFDTHYPLSERARARVAPITLDFVRQTAGECPFVLAGDFNAQPDELAIRFLAG
ncbi:MAG: endonuclease/exonuclease/phosphatase family protein [Anaerolineae bacterium]|nr:endonuclease/exonuclease/phosphatase family protein [Anaerolineae bacterium]